MEVVVREVERPLGLADEVGDLLGDLEWPLAAVGEGLDVEHARIIEVSR